MLVRAARRKAPYLGALLNLASIDQLQLPWLCPAYNLHPRDGHRKITIGSKTQRDSLAKRRNSKDSTSVPSRRALATAVGYNPIDDVPFENMGSMPPSSPLSSVLDARNLGNYTELRQFTPNPIYLGGSLSTAPIRHRRSKGVGGELSEMESVFHACLQVGRIERAGVILRRICSVGVSDSAMLRLHNSYLRSAVEQLGLNPSKSANQNIHKWFELDLIRKGLVPDAETIAYLVKASLPAEVGKRERLVRRYLDMIPTEMVYEVFCLGILTAEEVNHVAHICPSYNLAEEPTMLTDDGIDPNKATFEIGDTKAEPPRPSVRPTDQKGMGLKSLKHSLSLFSNASRQGIDMSKATDEEKRELQTRLEEDAVTSAIDRWREENSNLMKMGINSKLQTKCIGARMWRWHVDLENHLAEELLKVEASEAAEVKTHTDQERCTYGPFLRLVPLDKLAAITILSFMTTTTRTGIEKGIALSSAILAIARAIEEESLYERLQQAAKSNIWPKSVKRPANARSLTPELLETVANSRQQGALTRLLNSLRSQNAFNKSQMPEEWPLTIRAKVGAVLMSALIEVAKMPVSMVNSDTKNTVTQMQPAFMHAHQYKMGKRVGMIMSNKALIEQLRREPVHSLLAKQLPMLVTPEPWKHFNKGGFLLHPAKMMRIKMGDKDQRHYAEAAIDQGDMEQTFRALDVLGRQTWQINKAVFDVMLEAWNTGEPVANLAPESPNLTMPPEPNATLDPVERRKWVHEVKAVENLRGSMHSQRCFQNFQLEIARALRNETFYFPHNVDFRGRAYPIPPYLNHMGADHCRGLLMFGKGKALGDGGLRWLKIHLANVYGFDKASLTEREAFATSHLEDIYDSANAPLQGKRWWLEAEDPWQSLAACIELRNALESGDPSSFISNLPVHQDGTCNGLQHYAALGGDTWGAKQVNLEPGDRPADVYSAVANLVKESIAEDNLAGHPMAAILNDRISRKIVKQTVMTNVYGVTYIGAQEQVRKQLLAAYHDLPNTDQINPSKLASYVATKIFKALSSMFKGAHDIQHWLGACASRISTSLTPEQLDRLEGELPNVPALGKAKVGVINALNAAVQFKSSVIWTTPLHMPVVQPYRKAQAKMITTRMQKLNLSEPHCSQPVSKRKQLQGFPPNFIHSLDATHMLLSALKCDERGLAFAAVHDSFWTHASDISTMNDVLRDTFIQIHSDDVIGRLAAEFTARYKGCMYLATIHRDSPVYKKITAWRLANRTTRYPWKYKNVLEKDCTIPKINELLLERSRARLLKSLDPAEVAKGKAMITPAAIFEKMSAEAELEIESDVEDGMRLGDISTREARLSVDQESQADLPASMEESFDTPESSLPTTTAPSLSQDSGGDTGAVPSNPSSDDTQQFERYFTSGRLTPQKAVTQIWLPLTFPQIPQKGQFDVSRLRDSQYFFS